MRLSNSVSTGRATMPSAVAALLRRERVDHERDYLGQGLAAEIGHGVDAELAGDLLDRLPV